MGIERGRARKVTNTKIRNTGKEKEIEKKKHTKNIGLPEQHHFCLPGGAETDAVQAILARYLQRRLQGSQLSTPPPPAVLFSSNNQARVRQAPQRTTGNALPRNVSEKENREHVEDYEDYEDDLEGFEDSERSRTRFDLFAGKSLRFLPYTSSGFVLNRVLRK